VPSAMPTPDVPLGVVLPTHGFTAPWTAFRGAFALPGGHGRPAFVVPTRAGFMLFGLRVPGVDGSAGWAIAAILRAKGYRIRGVYAADMPSSWIALHPGVSDAHGAKLQQRARTRVERIAQSVAGGRHLSSSYPSLVTGLLLLPISLGYLAVGRFGLASLFFADSRCNGCAACAKRCPIGAIRMRETRSGARPYWLLGCESCQRCMAYCPRRAVQAGWIWAAGLSLLAGAFATALLGSSGDAVWWSVSMLCAVLFLALGRPVLNFLGRHGLGGVLGLPTRFYRRYHEPQTSVAELAGAEGQAHASSGTRD